MASKLREAQVMCWRDLRLITGTSQYVADIRAAGSLARPLHPQPARTTAVSTALS